MRKTLSLVLAACSVGACGPDLPSHPPAAAIPEDATRLPDDAEALPGAVVVDEPSFLLHLQSGEELSFYIYDDGTVGVAGLNRQGGSVLDDPLMQDASPAEIFHAVSNDPMPPGLAIHHGRLAADGEVPPLEEAIDAVPAGWRNRVRFSSSSPCLNATFAAAHGAHPSYPSSIIRLNTSATWTYVTRSVDRYKAGFCLQSGQGKGALNYKIEETGPRPEALGTCGYSGYRNIYGQTPAFSMLNYSATTYRSYLWWRPSDAPRRKFWHRAGYSVGDTYDWAQRFRVSGPCP